jgi:copper chaperone CopZ
VKNLDKEIKKAVESLEGGQKIQLELDKKNQVLKIWKLKLDRIEVKDGIK